MATQNLGNVRALIVSTIAPSNTNLIWRDTSTTPFTTRIFNTQTSIWEAIAMAAGGEDNTASNLGGGNGIFAQKVGVDLQFKSLVQGSNVTLTPSATEIMITATGEANTSSNLGATGEGLAAPKSGVNLPFKRIIGGTNVTLSSDANAVTINSSSSAAMAMRTISSQSIANGATYTVDMSMAEVNILNVASGATAITITANNASATIERRNKIVINNTANTAGLTITFSTATITTWRYALNEFPGTFPTMNVDGGSRWAMEFENEATNAIYIDFAQINT